MDVLARFRISFVCENCTGRGSLDHEVPCGDDAPTSVDELVESGALGRLRFRCYECDGLIAIITGIKQTYLRGSEAA